MVSATIGCARSIPNSAVKTALPALCFDGVDSNEGADPTPGASLTTTAATPITITSTIDVLLSSSPRMGHLNACASARQ
jgi:hypothetical protein